MIISALQIKEADIQKERKTHKLTENITQNNNYGHVRL